MEGCRMSDQSKVVNHSGNSYQYMKRKNSQRAKNKENAVPKQETVETNAFSFDTSLPYFNLVLGDYASSAPCTIQEIRMYTKNPQFYNKELRRLAWWAYHVMVVSEVP